MKKRLSFLLITLTSIFFASCDSNSPTHNPEINCDMEVEIASTNTTNNGDGILIEVILKDERRQYYKLIAPGELCLINYLDYYQSSSFSVYDYIGDLVIPKDITLENTKYEVTQIKSRVCYENAQIKSVTIPSSVISIGSEAFYRCTALNTVIMGNNVTSIAASTFLGCTNLTSINISKSIITISDGLFSNCKSLQTITLPDNVTSIGSYSFGGCVNLHSINLPEKVNYIGSSAFNNCKSLTTIYIPPSVRMIDEDAFIECTGITAVNISDPNAWCTIKFNGFSANPLFYAHNLYLNGDLLTDIHVSDGITNWSFSGCNCLKSVTVQDQGANIEYMAFYNCSSLTSITWNTKGFYNFQKLHTYTPYEDNPFYIVRNQITSFTFGREVELIPDCLCYGMTKLRSVDVPRSVTNIGNSAFMNCSGLEFIIDRAAKPQQYHQAFRGIEYTCPLYVPDESVMLYKEADGWKEFKQILPLSSFGS